MTTNRIIKVVYDGHHDRVWFYRVNNCHDYPTWPTYSRNRLFTLIESLIVSNPRNLLLNRSGWVYTNRQEATQ